MPLALQQHHTTPFTHDFLKHLDLIELMLYTLRVHRKLMMRWCVYIYLCVCDSQYARMQLHSQWLAWLCHTNCNRIPNLQQQKVHTLSQNKILIRTTHELCQSKICLLCLLSCNIRHIPYIYTIVYVKNKSTQVQFKCTYISVNVKAKQ